MSDELKFTPGPWDAICPGAAHPGIDSSDGVSVVMWGASHEECGVRGRTKEETIANARLIAAAPELLEALRPFANFACDLKEGETCDCHNCVARAVIAKATGKAPNP